MTFNTTKSVKVKNDTGVAITVKFNGTNKDVAKDATETFSYTWDTGEGTVPEGPAGPLAALRALLDLEGTLPRRRCAFWRIRRRSAPTV